MVNELTLEEMVTLGRRARWWEFGKETPEETICIGNFYLDYDIKVEISKTPAGYSILIRDSEGVINKIGSENLNEVFDDAYKKSLQTQKHHLQQRQLTHLYKPRGHPYQEFGFPIEDATELVRLYKGWDADTENRAKLDENERVDETNRPNAYFVHIPGIDTELLVYRHEGKYRLTIMDKEGVLWDETALELGAAFDYARECWTTKHDALLGERLNKVRELIDGRIMLKGRVFLYDTKTQSPTPGRGPGGEI